MKLIRIKILNSTIDILTNSSQLHKSLMSEIKHTISDSAPSEYKCKLLILPPWTIANDIINDYSINDTIILDTTGKKDSISTLITSSLKESYLYKWYISKYVINSLQEKNQIFSIHASCVNINGKGVLFVGSKDSGKSSLTIASYLWHNARFVSDDITIVYGYSNRLVATGMFNGININNNEIETLRTGIQFEELPSSFKKRLIIKEQYSATETNIDYIVFPKTNTQKSSIRRISTEKGIKLVQKNYIFKNFSENDEVLLKKDGFRNIEFFEMHLNNSIDKNVELLIDMLNL